MDKKYLLGLIWLLMHACQTPHPDVNQLKDEIISIENAFSEKSQDDGIAEAFLAYAADDAVLNRGNNIIKGKEAIKAYFNSRPYENPVLSWTPEFVDVSSSGDMAYTYGPYSFSAVDSIGNKITANGYFHTVWKKQKDGSWKYVYD